MGRVVTQLKLTNHSDVVNAASGVVPGGEPRSISVEALVDTGATMLAIPEELVEALGVMVLGMRRARDARGVTVEIPWVGGLLIEILGRQMTCDALVLPRGAMALIGQIPLEALDLVVDPKTREARVNPASPDMPLLDLMALAS
jgi:clan AA aspartic protease